MSEIELKCCVSGSYSKFKPEVDRTIEELRDNGIQVLQPSVGWISRPSTHISWPELDFRPLPGEIGQGVKQIEDNFLEAIRKSDFLYVYNPEGYIGDTAAMEIGFALALGKPIFMRYEPSQWIDVGPDTLKEVVIAEPKDIKALLTQSGKERVG